MPDPRKASVQTAGSLTPQLEGAPRSTPHTDRSRISPPNPDPKGGNPHT